MSITKKRKCLLCGNNSYRVLKKINIQNHAQKIVICKNCSFVYQLFLYEENLYKKLLCRIPKDYESHSFNRACYIYDFCEKYWNRNKALNVLDVGCGQGGILFYLKFFLGKGDFTGYTLEDGKKKFDNKLNIVYWDVEDERFFNSYDFIVMSHVLEHLLNPLSFLKKLRLYKNGILYIEVPNFHWEEVHHKPMFAPEHIYYFSVNSLRNILKLAHFDIVKIKESKYWGNIKVIATKKIAYADKVIKIQNYRKILLKYYLLPLVFPFFRLKKKLFGVNANG